MRYPPVTPYQGGYVNYDEQMTPEQYMKRMVYGLPPPLLGYKQYADVTFYGRLFDQLANAHGAYIKECQSESRARSLASEIRREIPRELFSVKVKNFEPDFPGWHVFVYNHQIAPVRFELHPMYKMGLPPAQWVSTKEVARILHVDQRYVIRLARRWGIEPKILGGRRQHYYRRDDLAVLANRPRQKKRSWTS